MRLRLYGAKWPPAISAHLSYTSADNNGNYSSPEPTRSSNQSNKYEKTEETKHLEKSSIVSLVGLFVKLFQNTKGTFLQTSVLSSDLNKVDFIRCGWKRENEGILTNSNMKTAESTEFDLRPLDEVTSWYTIDGEKFEARPIHVKILPNKIKVFCPPT